MPKSTTLRSLSSSSTTEEQFELSVDDNENIKAVISRPSLDTTNRDEENKVRPSTTQRSPKTTTNRIVQTIEEKDDIAMIPSIEARPTIENMNENQDKPNVTKGRRPFCGRS